MKNLVKANGFPLLRSMMDDYWNMDSFFNRPVFNTELLPAVNIRDKKHGYELEVAAPGFEKEDFNVSVDNGMLTISADTTQENQEDQNDYTRREFSRTSFTRSFSLPDNISQEDITANYKDGLLHLTLKKSKNALKEPKIIKID